MKTGRLCLRIDDALLEEVKRIAEQRGVTVTFLVEQYFRQLVYDTSAAKSDEELGVVQA